MNETITITIDGWFYWLAIAALSMNVINDGLGLFNKYLGKKLMSARIEKAVLEALDESEVQS